MVSSWKKGKRSARIRAARRQFWAGVLCGASFLGGQLLFGEQPQNPAAFQPAAAASSAAASPPGSLLKQYLQAKSQTVAELAGQVEAAADELPAKSPAADAGSANPAATTKATPGLKPATVEALSDPADAPLVEARPLPVQETKRESAAAAPSSATEEHLAPVVPAWAVAKRPPAGTSPTNRAAPAASADQASADAQPAQPRAIRTSGLTALPAAAPKRIENTHVAAPTGMAHRASPTSSLPAASPSSAAVGTAAAPAKPLRIEIGKSKSPPPASPAPAARTAASATPPQDAHLRVDLPALTRSTPAKVTPVSTGTAGSVQPASASSDSAPATPQNKDSARSPSDTPARVARADFEARLAQAAPPQPLPSPGGAMEEDFGRLPDGSPFEAIPQSGSIKLRVRRSLLLRTKVDIYRTAIVDESVCDIVQFTPREVSIIGRSLGQTHVTFWFDDPAMAPLTYLVEVKPDAEQVKADEDKYQLLENVINEMFPDSKIHLVIVADKLLVKGQAKDSEEAAQIMTIVRAQAGARGGQGVLGNAYGGLAEGLATPVLSMQATGGNPGPGYQIINMLRVPGVQQVALKVKIAELNRSAARGFGVDINGTIDLSDSVNGSKLFLASLLNASSTGGTALLTQFDGDDINLGIRYLQHRGVVRLLSEPTLVTLSGRPATFIAGGEFAVPTVVGSVGLNAVTTDFRAFGAIISFLPTIVDKDRVRLQVAPEFSQLNSALSVGNTPGLNVRAATTTVEMREGQTLAIAGLLEDTYKASNTGDLPGLAKIFGRRDTSRSETELIILVTPELVHPMEPEEVPPLPGFDVTEPTASRFFLHGDIEGNPNLDYRSTVWPRLRKRYGMGGPAMTSGPFGHGQ